METPLHEILSVSVEVARYAMIGNRRDLGTTVIKLKEMILNNNIIEDTTKQELYSLLSNLISTANKSPTTCPARKIATQIVSILHNIHISTTKDRIPPK